MSKGLKGITENNKTMEVILTSEADHTAMDYGNTCNMNSKPLIICSLQHKIGSKQG